MEEIIERMKVLILAETSEDKGYSQETLNLLRLDDAHYYETVMRETR